MANEGSSTVDKAVQVLEVLQASGEACSLGEIAAELALPKATAHRLLQSLRAHDLVQAEGEGRYALGVGLVRLGLGALARSPVAHVSKDELERAAAALGQTFFLVAARAGKLWVLERAEGHALLRAVPELGAEVPIASTASGRLYAALAPERVDAELLPRTARFRERVAHAAGQGWDVNDGEWIEGVRVFAAPIRVRDALVGCVACAGASASLEGDAGSRALRYTRHVADRIAGLLSNGTTPGRRTA